MVENLAKMVSQLLISPQIQESTLVAFFLPKDLDLAIVYSKDYRAEAKYFYFFKVVPQVIKMFQNALKFEDRDEMNVEMFKQSYLCHDILLWIHCEHYNSDYSCDSLSFFKTLREDFKLFMKMQANNPNLNFKFCNNLNLTLLENVENNEDLLFYFDMMMVPNSLNIILQDLYRFFIEKCNPPRRFVWTDPDDSIVVFMKILDQLEPEVLKWFEDCSACKFLSLPQMTTLTEHLKKLIHYGRTVDQVKQFFIQVNEFALEAYKTHFKNETLMWIKNNKQTHVWKKKNPDD